jgi:flavin-binding protein dodecin
MRARISGGQRASLAGTAQRREHDGDRKEASETLHGISGIDIINTTATVKNNKITQYRATVKLAFLVEKK